ncbi:CapA family protein [Amycolatopsis acidiphila]|uniref:CapA family protein n=1 Tax=Amycolatopsis acidiphila TaxID=715473 RepID=A0A558AJ10_9PSEU|nr:CapA family protein [Amycolatopsis acidiphila]TVT24252.1 CapA family protein [Amycolatopsis acidiphila]UIJ62617.1 CapA family protein [Amycolatopsis acidiphila]
MRFVVALSGDTMITRGALVRATPAAEALRTLLREADVTFTNLEMVTADHAGQHTSHPLNPTLTADARVLDELADIGIDVVSFANNHTLNLGVPGLAGTIRELAARRLAHAGVGNSLEEATLPAYVDRQAGSVAVIACTSTFGTGDDASGPADLMPPRPGLNPLRFHTRLRVPPEQLTALRAAHRDLGLDEQLKYVVDMGFLPPLPDERDKRLFGQVFRAADEPVVETWCDSRDLERIQRWVAEAAERADVVVVSVHGHEQGGALTEPAAFQREFAHAVIDSGADVVAGHGPHRLRGIEFYRGCPIFYSLGNFVDQIHLQDRLTPHSYDVFGVAPGSPGARAAVTSPGFLAHPEYARSVVATLTFDDGDLTGVELWPISLGRDRPAAHRGTPELASGAESAAIGAELTELSQPYGTRLQARGEWFTVHAAPDHDLR